MLLDQNYAIRQCTLDGFGFSYGIVAGWVPVNLVPLMQIPEKCTKFSNFILEKISGRKKKKKVTETWLCNKSFLQSWSESR